MLRQIEIHCRTRTKRILRAHLQLCERNRFPLLADYSPGQKVNKSIHIFPTLRDAATRSAFFSVRETRRHARDTLSSLKKRVYLRPRDALRREMRFLLGYFFRDCNIEARHSKTAHTTAHTFFVCFELAWVYIWATG